MPVPLLLLPGMDGTGRLFAPLVAHLPAAIDARVLAYPPDRPLAYDALLDLLRPQRPRDQPWCLLGESFSGPLALRLAAERPPGLRGVILAASFVTSPIAWAPRWLHGLARPALFSALALRLAGRVLGTHRCPPDVAATFRAANTSVAPAVLACRARATLGVDLRPLAAALADVPTLVLAARRDRVIGRRQVADIQTLLPHADVQWFDAPHLLLQARPGPAAAAIAAFMRV
jgi:pimeloyl-[acyl-carrier protein] methyl ester esterase